MDVSAAVGCVLVIFYLFKLRRVLSKRHTSFFTVPRKLALSLVILQFFVMVSQLASPLRRREDGSPLADEVSGGDILHAVGFWIAGCAYSFFGNMFLLFYIQVLELHLLNKGE